MSNGANPFTPHQPIHPEYFAGRVTEIIKINWALNQTRHEKTQHLFLTGDRGIGKTSLALYARYLAQSPNAAFKSDFHFATAYHSVEKNQTLTDVCRGLATKLLDDVEKDIAAACMERLKKLNLHFSIHVPGVGEVSVAKQEHTEGRDFLQSDFVKAVEEFWDSSKDARNGILLIIDELHNLASFAGLGSFFKIISENWAVNGYRQIMFMAVGLPTVSARVSTDDPSAPRIFSFVELSRMTDEESIAVLKRCLSGTSKTMTDDAAQYLARSSGGVPYFLHQLGYDAFQVDSDGVIDKTDANLGLITSLIQFERMFFGKMYKSVEGKVKQKIVDRLAEEQNVPLTAIQLSKELKVKNVHQYLIALEQDDIVEKIDARYRLSSNLLAIYVRIFKMLPRATQKKVQAEAKLSPPAHANSTRENSKG
jgi:hypothetical protein